VSRFQRRTVPARPDERLQQAMSSFGRGLGQALAGQPGAPASGPVVRVSRGNNVTIVPVGAR
jgi:pilus assembly protein CpaB